jgi:hypothetical protein
VIVVIDVKPALFERARTFAAVLSDTPEECAPLCSGQAEDDNWAGSSGRNSEANR